MSISAEISVTTIHIHGATDVRTIASESLVIKDANGNTAYWHTGDAAIAEALAAAWAEARDKAAELRARQMNAELPADQRAVLQDKGMI